MPSREKWSTIAYQPMHGTDRMMTHSLPWGGDRVDGFGAYGWARMLARSRKLCPRWACVTAFNDTICAHRATETG
jgi:hypothetical protein